MTAANSLTLHNEQDLKVTLQKQYLKSVENYFGDNDKALEFMTNAVALVQRNPKLLECKPDTLFNSLMMMASLKLMPSGVSGEAYIIPYKGDAQFQLGYQGLVTLFYRAGVRSIIAEIVRSKDVFDYVNGEVHHRPDVFADDRGEPIGAYVIVELDSGAKLSKAMSKKEILAIGQKFSQSFKSDFSPWDAKNDPELWMWKKTVLKQAAKLVPKNETLYRAVAEDNKESVIQIEPANDNALPGPVVDVEEWRTQVLACKELGALERVAADMPAAVRTSLKSDLEAVKKMIMSEAKAA